MLTPIRPLDLALATNLSDLSTRSRVLIEARYQFADGEHDLSLRMRGTANHHVKAVRQGEAEFALIEADPLIFVLFRFGDAIPWTASNCRRGQVAAEGLAFPPSPGATDEKRAFLSIALAEAETGTARATRNVTLSLDFTRALHAAIRRLAQARRKPKAAARVQSDLDRRFPTAEALVARATVRCLGGP